LHGWLAPPQNLHHGGTELDWVNAQTLGQFQWPLSIATIATIAPPKKPKTASKKCRKQTSKQTNYSRKLTIWVRKMQNW